MIALQSSRSERADARERVILALDFPAAAPALDLLSQLERAQSPKWVKVGLELFAAEGPAIVHTLHERGYSVFLDLKLHDIPNTVAAAIRGLGSLGVEMLTVHGSGGPAMLQAAAEAAAAQARPLRLLAVTVLTSMDDRELAAIGVTASPQQQVLRLAQAALAAGISGVVASPQEAELLRLQPGSRELHIVTPGIRPKGSGADDQKRAATPAAALDAGASQIVVGRPVTRAADPAEAFAAILAEMEEALREKV